MSDSVLTILKFCLLAALYLFLARVVWIVAHELQGTPVSLPTSAPGPTPPEVSARGRRRGWRLVVITPETEQGHTFAIDGEITIGRGGGCGITLTSDTFVSQVHARAFDRDGNLWLEDLGSTNGSFVNGEQISQPVKLRKGDRVQIGETAFEVER